MSRPQPRSVRLQAVVSRPTPTQVRPAGFCERLRPAQSLAAVCEQAYSPAQAVLVMVVGKAWGDSRGKAACADIEHNPPRRVPGHAGATRSTCCTCAQCTKPGLVPLTQWTLLASAAFLTRNIYTRLPFRSTPHQKGRIGTLARVLSTPTRSGENAQRLPAWELRGYYGIGALRKM
ncbi:unnamed protein product [Boreogadus saida]